jgi:hypothetical protein
MSTSKDIHQRLTEDALWEETAMELVNQLDRSFQKMFRHEPEQLEILGRYILRERVRKYREGQQDAKPT